MFTKTTPRELIEYAKVRLDITLSTTPEFSDNSESLLNSVKNCYDTVISRMNAASESYYAGKPTEMTDAEFDLLMDILVRFEEKNPALLRSDSPTQKVNGGTSDDKVKHQAPMLSLRDVFNMNDLQAWVETRPTTWCVEPKIDGLSIEFVYDLGLFVGAYTRGNGYEGEDVSAVVRNMPSIPNQIPWTGFLAVRGEVYMSKVAFERYNRDIGKAENPRNLSVGLIKRKSDSVTGGRFLDAFIFNLQVIQQKESSLEAIPYNLSMHANQLQFLRDQGFPVVDSYTCNSWEEVEHAVTDISSRRPDLDYNIDGAVIKSNDIGYRHSVGDDGTVPRWAVAYKYPAIEGSTRVNAITFQLGKTGKLTPVALLEPVKIDGSTISRCTLHNKKRMEELDIRVGDIVKLHKSGDIIPKITSATHTEQSKAFYYPTECPVCKARLDGEKCVNEFCNQKLESKLYHWADKGGIDIKGVSGSLVSQLIERKLLRTPADFYKLTPADLYKVPKMGAVKVKKTLQAIDESRNRSFASVLVALGIDSLGWAAATKLTSHISTWDELLALSEVDCINYTGYSVGKKLHQALQTDYYRELIRGLSTIYSFEKK